MPNHNRHSTTFHQLHTARRLWFGGYHGILSTHSIALPDYPFGSLVPLSRGTDGFPILLLSHLAQHTRNLENNPHCSLLLKEKGASDVQQLGRLTCLAIAERVLPMQPSHSERYFRYFPDSRTFHETLNFQFFRLKPVRFYLVGGFGTARWFDTNRLVPVCRLTEEVESNLIIKLTALPQLRHLSESNAKIVGVDCMGLDLKTRGQFERLMLPKPTSSQSELLYELEHRLARGAIQAQNGYYP